MNAITFTLPSCPPSVNSLYQILYSERTVRLKPEVLEWKTRAGLYVKHFPFPVDETSIIRLDRVYGYPWFSAEGKWLSRDTPNMDKALFDLIAECLGFLRGDARFKQGWMGSINSKVERTVVTLTEVRQEIWSMWMESGEMEVKKA